MSGKHAHPRIRRRSDVAGVPVSAGAEHPDACSTGAE